MSDSSRRDAYGSVPSPQLESSGQRLLANGGEEAACVEGEILHRFHAQGDIESLPYDILRMRHWALMANGGFLTHTHHDAHGLATWVSVTCGGKMWTLFRPRSGKIEDVEPVLRKMAESRDETYPGAIPKGKVDVATVPLLPGSVL